MGANRQNNEDQPLYQHQLEAILRRVKFEDLAAIGALLAGRLSQAQGGGSEHSIGPETIWSRCGSSSRFQYPEPTDRQGIDKAVIAESLMFRSNRSKQQALV